MNSKIILTMKLKVFCTQTSEKKNQLSKKKKNINIKLFELRKKSRNLTQLIKKIIIKLNNANEFQLISARSIE